jgi:ribose transport system substrate-binding protein
LQPTIAVFTKNRTNPAYAAARLGAERVGRDLGVHIRHYVPQKPDDVDEQIALIDEAVAARPDAIVLVPVHPTAINAAIRKIVGAGIPLIGFLNRFSEKGPTTYIGSDDYPLALKIAIYLCEKLERRGELVVIEGPPESVTSLERVRGFHDAVTRFPQVRIAASICGDYQRDVAKRAAAELFNSGVRFDGVLAANDVMALGMIDALAAIGRESKVIGVNAIPEAVTAVGEGKLLATTDFDAMKMAALATEAAVRHLRGEALLSEITLPVQIVDRRNYTEWDKPFEERALVRWEDAVASTPKPLR